MAYGRVYIDNLRKKVTVLFDELKKENKLCESAFIELFKKNHPKDFAMLQFEWKFKVHEFKKNRKGNPKPHPIRPEKILSNMYRNYYYKLIKSPTIHHQKTQTLNEIRRLAGKYGYKIKEHINSGTFNVINTSKKIIEKEDISFTEVKKMFSPQGLYEIKQRLKREKEEQSNEC